MHITRLQFSNFKRFTELTIDLSMLAKPPKLVLLIGTNGSGKSSVFDAFEVIGRYEKEVKSLPNDESITYYKKNKNQQFSLKATSINETTIDETVITEFNYNSVSGFISETSNNDSFYGRSSLRQVPRLTRKGFSQQTFNFQRDSDRPLFYIDREERFENDVEHVIKLILEEVFKNSGRTTQEIINRYIAPINQAFEGIFGTSSHTSLRFYSLTPPTEGNTAEILFQKGETTIHYNLLSSGEKEIFNILFNLLSRRSYYKNTIYFLDELDLHLNTKLQYSLLKEITEHWIPADCQLWTASHSLGFIEYANDTDHSATIDFDDLDFDQPQTLYPQPKNRLETYAVAVPKEMLFKLFKGKRIVICENQNDEYYNLLGLEDTIFVGVKNSRELFLTVKRDLNYQGLRDRDFLTDRERMNLKQKFPHLHILEYYCFENYLYHPDNIAEINPTGFEKQAYTDEIFKQKQQRLHYILPDIKVSRQNYEELKEHGIKEKDIDSLIKDLESNHFESYYKYFDMKTQFGRQSLEAWNLSQKSLVQTQWFRNRIVRILAS
jgi:AAA15 family ATPase/GTPase